MRKKAHQNHKKSSASKVITGMLFSGILGATVGWLTAPASGEELRHRLREEVMGAREKAKSAAGNVESTARELIAEVNEDVDKRIEAASRRKATAAARTS